MQPHMTVAKLASLNVSILQLKVFYLHSLLLIQLINDYFLCFRNDFICLLVILCSCKAL